MTLPISRTRPPGAVADGAGTGEPTFRALISTFGVLKRVMDQYFAQFGVSGAQWGVLRTLQRMQDDGRPEPRLTDLGNHLLVRPPSITGAVDRLQRLGLVRRSASATDQRAKHVSLTPAGRSLVDRVMVHHPAQIDAVLDALDPVEQSQLRTLLSRLEAHLQTMARLGENAGGAGGREHGHLDHEDEVEPDHEEPGLAGYTPGGGPNGTSL